MMSNRRLEGKSVLITGSATGIGQAVAIRFVREGANVALNRVIREGEPAVMGELTEEAGRAAKEEGRRFLVVQADVSKEREVAEMCREVVRELGRLDILINNAGIQKGGGGQEASILDFDRVIAVNLRGAYYCAREAIGHFLSQGGGGVIINNSSMRQILPRERYLSYRISRAGMENFTRTLALEHAASGIRVNAVGLGAIDTPVNREREEDPAHWKELEAWIPMRRAGTVEEIAAVMAFLASDDASYITGQTLYICGGLTLCTETGEERPGEDRVS